MPREITSAQNEKLKEFSKLYRRKYRERTGLYIIEGIHLVEEALKNDAELVTAFLRGDFGRSGEEKKLVKRLEERGTEIFVLPAALFDRIVATETPQGIAAVSRQPDCEVGRFFDGASPDSNIIVLDRLQDPGNLGTIIRTADAAGFRHVLVMKGTADIFAPKTVRAAAGSLYRVRFAYSDDPVQALEFLKRHGKKTVCTSPRAETVCFDADIAVSSALIIGNEAQGACEAFLRESDLLVSIPMEGTVESLNASAAASVLMYESVRRRLILNKQ